MNPRNAAHVLLTSEASPWLQYPSTLWFWNEVNDRCRGVCEMRVTAEAAQRFLDQERGMRDALTNALQYVTRSPQPSLYLQLDNSCPAILHVWHDS